MVSARPLQDGCCKNKRAPRNSLAVVASCSIPRIPLWFDHISQGAVPEGKDLLLTDLGGSHFSCYLLERKREEWMHGGCFVMDSLGNFHHSCNLLRWTHVLLSQPVKRNKMSGRQELDFFQKVPALFSKKSFLLWYQTTQSCRLSSLALALISSVPILSCEGGFFHISDVYTEVSQVFIQRNQCLRPRHRPWAVPRGHMHPSTSWCSGTMTRLWVVCLQYIFQLQRDEGFHCSCM